MGQNISKNQNIDMDQNAPIPRVDRRDSHVGHLYCGEETWTSLRHNHQVLYKYELPDISKEESSVTLWYPGSIGHSLQYVAKVLRESCHSYLRFHARRIKATSRAESI
jgi:hypothetical protein